MKPLMILIACVLLLAPVRPDQRSRAGYHRADG
jgi:hypothetical protein